MALAVTLALPIQVAGSIPRMVEDPDPCNGTETFNWNNIANLDLLQTLRLSNPQAVRSDGSLDSAKVTAASWNVAPHAILQLRELPGQPLDRVTLELAPTTWQTESTIHRRNQPGYVTVAEARDRSFDDLARDSLLGRLFTFFMPLDAVYWPYRTFHLRLSGYSAITGQRSSVCLNLTVSDLYAPDEWARAEIENREPVASLGFDFNPPQPAVWLPAHEQPGQRGGYGVRELRIDLPHIAPGSLRILRLEQDDQGKSAQWIDYSHLLIADDVRRPHSLGEWQLHRMGTESSTRMRVFGPGYRFRLSDLPGLRLEEERLRIRARSQGGGWSITGVFCGTYQVHQPITGVYHVQPPVECS